MHRAVRVLSLLAGTFAACDGDGRGTSAPPAASGTTIPREPDAAARERLAAHREPRTWPDLDAARPGRRLRDPRTGVVFVRVPAGTFTMGGTEVPHEQPPHLVQITRDLLLAETELTIAQWQRHVAEFAGDAAVPVPAGEASLPMPLSWRDASAYCERYGYRLPSEAEWERACRGDLAPADEPWRTETGMRAAAWFHRNSGQRAQPVATRAPNPFGLHDMLGNVWEWCADDYDPAAYTKRAPPGPAVDPRAPSTVAPHVLRGGSWFSVPPAQPETRSAAAIDERTPFYGLRPACTLPAGG